MYCKKCGTPNEEGAKFCRKCGTPLTGQAGNSQGAENGWENGPQPEGGPRPRYSPGQGPHPGYGKGEGPRSGYGLGGDSRSGHGPGGKQPIFEPEAADPEGKSEQDKMKKRLIAAICSVAALLLVCVGVGVFILISGNSAQAEKNFQEKIESGDKFLGEMDYDGAIDAFQSAIEIEPKKIEGYEKLADVYMQQKDYEKAEATLIEGIQTVQGSTVLQDKLDEVYEYIPPSDPELVLPTEAPPEPQQEQDPAASVETQTGAPDDGAGTEPVTDGAAGEGTKNETDPDHGNETETETEQAAVPEPSPDGDVQGDQNQGDGNQEGPDQEMADADREAADKAAKERFKAYLKTALDQGQKLGSVEMIPYTWGGNNAENLDKAAGIISAYMGDLDGDGISEMLTVSFELEEEPQSYCIAVEAFAVEDGNVVDKGRILSSNSPGGLYDFEESAKIFVRENEGRKYICFFGSTMATLTARGPMLTYQIYSWSDGMVKEEYKGEFQYDRQYFPEDVKQALDSYSLNSEISEIMEGQEGITMITELYASADPEGELGSCPATALFMDYTALRNSLAAGTEIQTEPFSETAGEGNGETEENRETAENGDTAAEGESGTESLFGGSETAESEPGQPETTQSEPVQADNDQSEAVPSENGEPETAQPETVLPESSSPEPEKEWQKPVKFSTIQEYGGQVYTVYPNCPQSWVSMGGSYMDSLAVYEDYIYTIRVLGTGASSGTLERCRLDRSENTVLISDITAWGNVWIAGGWLYYTTTDDNYVSSNLKRMNLTDPALVEELEGASDAFMTDGEHLYFSNSWQDTAGFSSRMDGTEKTGLSYPIMTGAVLDGGRIYYIQDQNIMSVNTDGSDARTEAVCQKLGSMEVYDGAVYYTDAGMVYRKISGSQEEPLLLTQLPAGVRATKVVGKTGENIYVCCYMEESYVQEHADEIGDQMYNIVMFSIPAAGGEAQAAGYWFES